VNRNQDKKERERRILEAVREAGAPIPPGELAREEPDFSIQTPDGVLGIELCEVLRPASTNQGIVPVEAESFHRSIMVEAQRAFQKSNALPTKISVDFSRAKGTRQDKLKLVKSLVDCVEENRSRANPAIALKGNELPEGFDHVLIQAKSGEWWWREVGGVTVSEIHREIAAQIAAKDAHVSRYRENLSAGTRAGIWLLLFTRPTVARSVPIPRGIGEWKFPFRFDRVFWFACLENEVVEIRRAESD
jgi:hypothetical protein